MLAQCLLALLLLLPCAPAECLKAKLRHLNVSLTAEGADCSVHCSTCINMKHWLCQAGVCKAEQHMHRWSHEILKTIRDQHITAKHQSKAYPSSKMCARHHSTVFPCTRNILRLFRAEAMDQDSST
jgi:hypothetical protein